MRRSDKKKWVILCIGECSHTACKAPMRAQHTAIPLRTHQRISSLTLAIKLKKLKASPFLRVHSSFGKRTVSTLDGALD
jgi:hypothetical protein